MTVPGYPIGVPLPLPFPLSYSACELFHFLPPIPFPRFPFPFPSLPLPSLALDNRPLLLQHHHHHLLLLLSLLTPLPFSENMFLPLWRIFFVVAFFFLYFFIINFIRFAFFFLLIFLLSPPLYTLSSPYPYFPPTLSLLSAFQLALLHVTHMP
ncbi:hypothetical protein K457DRAFT_668386 [Linnemannia elongata AG-77]|uniref:Uncharacterized protein n=1 Tax=Linnemannia elongata AG-77 TaxID=1314771 RepID=A0A197JRR6_9FUNG|nr:hypothetical protein K457DRAFT_668386 [Linnemannia elongata AG-77]